MNSITASEIQQMSYFVFNFAQFPSRGDVLRRKCPKMISVNFFKDKHDIKLFSSSNKVDQANK